MAGGTRQWHDAWRRWLAAGSLLLASVAGAQTTTGNATTGQAIWNGPKFCAGCHTVTGRPVNGANAGGHILYAIAQGMPASLTATEANDVAAYLGSFLGSGTVTVAPNSGANAIALPGITLNSVYGKFTGIVGVTAPTKGSVTYSGTSATYTPTPGQTGADSFTYQAVVSGGCTGGCSSVRTQSVYIGVPNDNWVNDLELTGMQDGATANNATATKEAGEPNHAGNAGGHSLWWSWSAKERFPVTITTAGSNFNTLLAVYIGGGVNTLTEIASNDNCSNGCQPAGASSVTFTPNKGYIYFIAVDGANGATGNIVLTLDQPVVNPPNDNFANAAVIVPPATVATGTSEGATMELDEPVPNASATTSNSVWWKWTAPSNGVVQVSLNGSNGFGFGYIQTNLGIYTGNSLATLTRIGVQPGGLFGGGGIYLPFSAQTFLAAAGTTYYFQVVSENGQSGDVHLELFKPGNNDFAAQLRLSGPNLTVADSNAGTTLESGEPGAGSTSVWFAWTAQGSAPVTIDVCGSNFNISLGVYTRQTFTQNVANLNLVTKNDNIAPGTCATQTLSFTPVDFTEYQIRLSGIGATSGNYVLHIKQRQPQAIDFRALPDRALGSGPYTLSASAPSGTPVVFSSQTPGTCGVSGSTLTLLALGVCTVAADNAGNADYFAAPQATQSFMITIPVVNFTGNTAVRRLHGAAGARDLPLNGAPIEGAIAVEPRSGGTPIVVFVFDGPVFSAGSASVTDAANNPVGDAVASFTLGGTEVRVALSNVADAQRVKVSVTGVNGATSASVALGVLAGDVGRSGKVTAADVAAIKARRNTNVLTDADARFDLDANGRIEDADLRIAKSRAGRVLPGN